MGYNSANVQEWATPAGGVEVGPDVAPALRSGRWLGDIITARRIILQKYTFDAIAEIPSPDGHSKACETSMCIEESASTRLETVSRTLEARKFSDLR
jgi:hypothetical protein